MLCRDPGTGDARHARCRRRRRRREARRHRRGAPACAGSRSSRGATSTTPRPAARSCTRRGSPRSGARPASRSRCARRTRPGTRRSSWRDGYRVIRKAGRYLVFPRAAFSEMMGWHGASDGLVEIWNGMPFFSPLWARRPHGRVAAPRARHDVGDDAAAAPRARSAARVEFDVAPPLYRRTPIVTLSESSKRRARARSCTSPPKRITVVPPGHRPVVLARRRARRRRRSSSRSAGSCR